MSRLQRTIGDEVRSYAKAQNFDLIFSGEAVVYAASAIDVTPGVLASLQAHAGAAKPAATTPAKPK
jgi:Skp family chaperone for outer membrane proteins